MYVDERGDVEYNLTVFHKLDSTGIKSSEFALSVRFLIRTLAGE